MSGSRFDDLLSRFSGTPGLSECPHRVPPQTRMVERTGHEGHVGHHKHDGQQSKAGPLREIDSLLAALAGAGHNLGHDLEARLRRAMAKMSRQARAELAAAIDDAFEAGAGIEQARLSISRHLPGGGDLGPASAEWWVSWVASRCPINADDRRYLGDLLRLLPARRRATAACWYSRAWLQAADAEPLPHRRDNAGRRAANATLRPVRRKDRAS